jgi:hypothetical protein
MRKLKHISLLLGSVAFIITATYSIYFFPFGVGFYLLAILLDNEKIKT